MALLGEKGRSAKERWRGPAEVAKWQRLQPRETTCPRLKRPHASSLVCLVYDLHLSASEQRVPMGPQRPGSSNTFSLFWSCRPGGGLLVSLGSPQRQCPRARMHLQ